MRIIVCIKQVPSSSEVTVDPVTNNLIREKSGTMMNPSDLNALEAALQLREQIQKNQGQNGGEEHTCKIAAITMGPPGAQDVLRTALAMGVDEAYLLTDRMFGGSDTIATAQVVAAGIEKCGDFDLIIAGAESSDGATGQVGPMVAEQLSIPHISSVQEMEIQEKGLILVKKFRQSKVKLKTSFPALVTVGYGANEPRLTTLRSNMAAKKKQITVFTNEELQLSAAQAGAAGSTTVVTDSFRPQVVDTCELISGNAREIASQILALIEKERGDRT